MKLLHITDEDVVVRFPALFPLVSPWHQVLASGSDGIFSSFDRWTLASNSSNFIMNGVQAGHVVQLVGPPEMVRPPGDILIVDSVEDHTLRVRRAGLPDGVGNPPAPPAGLSGIDFVVSTIEPQITTISRYILDTYKLATLFPLHSPVYERATTLLKEISVLTLFAFLLSQLTLSIDSPLDACSHTTLSELHTLIDDLSIQYSVCLAQARALPAGTKLLRA